MYFWILDMWEVTKRGDDGMDRIQVLLQKIDSEKLGRRKVGEVPEAPQEYLDFVAKFVDPNGMFKDEKAHKFIMKQFPNRIAEFESIVKDKRVYDDLKVQYFYEKIMVNYPDFYQCMIDAGIPECNIHHPLEKPGSLFRDAYKRAQMRMDLRARKKLCENFEKGETSALNAYLRIREKEDLQEEPTKEDSSPLSKPRKNKEEKINEDITIDAPSDNPAWIPESLEQISEEN